MNPLQSVASAIQGLFGQNQPSSQYLNSNGKPISSNPNDMQLTMNSANTAQPIAQTPIPTAAPIAQSPQTGGYSQDQVAQGISKLYGANTPILQDLPQLMAAGSQLPKGVDPMLPVIIALRETQGGKYNVGANNFFNLRNDQGKFQDYPDANTAINGNLDQGGQSGGFVGLVNGSKPQSQGIYQDFRQDPTNMAKFFSHYSPTADNNGDMNTQVSNYNWIRSHVLGLQ